MKSELKNSRYGLLLALFGALMITPDTLFMRLSEMPTWVMMAGADLKWAVYCSVMGRQPFAGKKQTERQKRTCRPV